MGQLKIISFLTVILSVHAATAQTPDEVKLVFPGKDLVFLQYNENMRIFMKDGVPVAESDHEKEIMILSEKNASMYSQYKVYHSGYNELTNLDAYTMVPNGDKYKKVKVIEQKTSSSYSNSVFYDDVKETSFNFPALTQNAVEHIEYSQFHKDAHLLTPFYLPGTLPVLNAAYTITVPNDIIIKFVVENDEKGSFVFSTEKKRKETIYKWTVKNIKGDENFGNAPDYRYFVPHIIIYIASFEGENGTQNFLNSLDDLYKWNAGFTKELNTTDDAGLKKIVDSLTAGKSNETDKARQIYSWVQQHIKYVAFENGLEGFRPRQAAAPRLAGRVRWQWRGLARGGVSRRCAALASSPEMRRAPRCGYRATKSAKSRSWPACVAATAATAAAKILPSGAPEADAT